MPCSVSYPSISFCSPLTISESTCYSESNRKFYGRDQSVRSSSYAACDSTLRARSRTCLLRAVVLTIPFSPWRSRPASLLSYLLIGYLYWCFLLLLLLYLFPFIPLLLGFLLLLAPLLLGSLSFELPALSRPPRFLCLLVLPVPTGRLRNLLELFERKLGELLLLLWVHVVPLLSWNIRRCLIGHQGPLLLHVVDQVNVLSADHPVVLMDDPARHAVPIVDLACRKVLSEALLVPCGLQLADLVEMVYATHHVNLVIVAISAQSRLQEIYSRRPSIWLVVFPLVNDELFNDLWRYGWLTWLHEWALVAVERLVTDVLLELLL